MIMFVLVDMVVFVPVDMVVVFVPVDMVVFVLVATFFPVNSPGLVSCFDLVSSFALIPI